MGKRRYIIGVHIRVHNWGIHTLSGTQWKHVLPGTHPSNEIFKDISNLIKYVCINFLSYMSDHNENFHTPRQHNCVYEISLGSDQSSINYDSVHQIWNLIDTSLMGQAHRVGVTTAPFINFSVNENIVLHNYLSVESLSNLTIVIAAGLWWHLSNMNVIFKRYQKFWQWLKKNRKIM